jgi:hypothetical protein
MWDEIYRFIVTCEEFLSSDKLDPFLTAELQKLLNKTVKRYPEIATKVKCDAAAKKAAHEMAREIIESASRPVPDSDKKK